MSRPTQPAADGVPVATARKWLSSVRRGWRLTRMTPGSSPRARACQAPTPAPAAQRKSRRPPGETAARAGRREARALSELRWASWMALRKPRPRPFSRRRRRPYGPGTGPPPSRDSRQRSRATEAGEALFGLGIALQWLGELRGRDPSLGAGVRGFSPASRCPAGRARRVLPLPRLPHDPRQRGRLPRLV